MSMFRTVRMLAAAMLLVCMLPLAAPAGDWRVEFDDICARVDTADSLSSEELARLISRADDVIRQIDESGDPARKVFMTRLKRCRDFFEFTLQTRESGQ